VHHPLSTVYYQLHAEQSMDPAQAWVILSRKASAKSSTFGIFGINLNRALRYASSPLINLPKTEFYKENQLTSEFCERGK